MRTEHEMMELILNTANKDERIRAVAMNGSRTNPNAPKDIFQDYDIVYFVTDMDSFIKDTDWIDIFGKRIVMQTPETMSMFPHSPVKCFTYLMQFTDGNRIDLCLRLLDSIEAYIKEDKLTIVLLDKDNCMPTIQAPTDEDYWVQLPSAEFFADCCNEFWWVCPYIAKGIWRKEILYAQVHINLVRDMLLKMLEWQVGIETDFSLSVGKCDKYLEKYISKEQWQLLLSTYICNDYNHIWESLFNIRDLFCSTSKWVAEHFGYDYPDEDDKMVTEYLKHIQQLSPNATEIG